MDGPFGAGVRLLIATGARREEIFGLRRAELRGDGFHLAAERSKNKVPRIIPISPLAWSAMASLPADGEFVVSLTGDHPFTNITHNKAKLDARAGVTDWRLHDLRRTVATGLQRLGVRLEMIEAVLGHVSGSRSGIVGVYQRHTFAAEAREALNVWARPPATADRRRRRRRGGAAAPRIEYPSWGRLGLAAESGFRSHPPAAPSQTANGAGGRVRHGRRPL